MAPEPIGLEFEELRTIGRADLLQGLDGGTVDLHHVHTVHPTRRDAITAGPFVDLGYRRMALDLGADLIVIVSHTNSTDNRHSATI